MEQHIKWLWLGLLISSVGWLGYHWIEFSNQVNSGKITVESIHSRAQRPNATTDALDNSLPTTPIPLPSNSQNATPSADNDLPTVANNNVAKVVPTDNSQTQNSELFIRVETDNFDILINRNGGVISQLALKKYPISIQQPEKATLLLHTNPPSYSLQNGLLSTQPAANHHSLYQSNQSHYALRDGGKILRVPLTWEEKGIKITKTYVFQAGSHNVLLEQRIDNQSEEIWQGSDYVQLSRARPTDEGSNFIYTYTGSAWWSEETGFKKIDFDEMAEESPTLKADDGWIAMIQHYFVSVIIPPKNQQNYFYTKRVNNQYIIGTVSPQKVLSPGQTHQFQSTLFLGPKKNEELTATHASLDYAIDYGIFHVIAAPIFWIIKHIYDLTGNWGIAIILITLLIKLLFLKLSEKSYRSMARMKLLAPRIQKLRERYGDDKQGMNQKMMQLYKEEKVNPLGGCLPIVIQIPVFISLYWVLIESVDLRQAAFIFWIRDLSIADPYFVMPILMGLTMFVQQRLNPPSADPMQQKVMQFLPLVFTVFFLFFPAGLVLYWIVNNLLSIAQQWYITQKINSEKNKQRKK